MKKTNKERRPDVAQYGSAEWHRALTGVGYRCVAHLAQPDKHKYEVIGMMAVINATPIVSQILGAEGSRRNGVRHIAATIAYDGTSIGETMSLAICANMARVSFFLSVLVIVKIVFSVAQLGIRGVRGILPRFGGLCHILKPEVFQSVPDL